ncbi:MAG: helicase-related protein, partial [Pontibacterium sp.]
MLQDDPSLEGIGLVIFDEFHERSLDADLGLALSFYGRELFREGAPLKLLVMSATLDGAAIAELLGGAPRVTSEGRSFPVDVVYGSHISAGDWNIWQLKSRLATLVEQALADTDGNVLVFLPGMWEINQLQNELNQRFANDVSLAVLPLYGNLSLADQQAAIAPPQQGERKVVLSTAIAETSLTIAGVTAVVDMGLSRQAVYDPASAMNRLVTRPVSKAASKQRAGRAGRLSAGKAYRIWSQSQHDALEAFAPPEMLQGDLAPLALQLISWGIDDPNELAWLDAPPVGAWNQACQLLADLKAISPTSSPTEPRRFANHQYHTGWALTAHGECLAGLPVHPRLAHMLVRAKAYGLSHIACDLAALLGESEVLPKDEAKRDNTVAHRLSLLSTKGAKRAANSATIQRIRAQSKRLQSLV